MNQTLILLHGLGRKKTSMQRLEKHLQAAGLTTLNLGYDSQRHTIDELVVSLSQQLPKNRPLSFVGHSLGGILATRLMANLPENSRGQLVLLGAPVKGARIAAALSKYAIPRYILGPALKDLSHATLPAEVPTLSVAGTNKFQWYMSGFYIHLLMRTFSQPNDGTVLETETHVANAQHLRVKAGHSFIMNNKQAQAAAREFLLTGN